MGNPRTIDCSERASHGTDKSLGNRRIQEGIKSFQKVDSLAQISGPASLGAMAFVGDIYRSAWRARGCAPFRQGCEDN